MKTLKMLIVVLCLTLFATTVLAEEPKTELALNKHRIWHAAAIPLHLFVHTNIHEATHVATGLSFGWTLKDYAPYPHINNGMFYFGRAALGAPVRRLGDIPRREWILEASTPYMLDAAMFVTADILLHYKVVNPKSIEGAIVFTAGMAAPWVDAFFNANNVFTKNNDFRIISEHSGWNRYALMAMMDGVLIIAGYRMVNQFINVFCDSRPVDDEAPPTVSLSPLLAPGFTGAAATFTF